MFVARSYCHNAKFCGDILLYCDNVNFSWRYFVSTKFTIVVLHNFCSIQNVCRKKLPPQFEGFVAILYLNKFLFRGAK
jgi:hypothetical protein